MNTSGDQAVQYPGQIRWAVNRLRAALDQAPDARFTITDAADLCQLDAPACHSVLKAFEDARLLRRRPDGVFVRAGLQ